VKVTSSGVPLDSLIKVVKASIRRAGPGSARRRRPPEDAGRQTRGAEDIEDTLVNATTSIRALASQAAARNDPWILSEGIIDISFAITATGTITLGIDGELSDEITHTLRLRLTPPTA
jgi:hypothetical protein